MNPTKLKARLAFLAVLLIGLSLSFYMHQTFNHVEQNKRLDTTKAQGTRLALEIEAELKRRFLQINAISHFFLSAEQVSYTEFTEFVELVYRDFPTDRRVTWVSEVTEQEKQSFINLIRQNPQPIFQDYDFFNFENGQKHQTTGQDGILRGVVYTYPQVKVDNFVGRILGPHSPIMSKLKPALGKDTPSVSSFWQAPPPLKPGPVFLIFVPMKVKGQFAGRLLSSNYINSSFKNAVSQQSDIAFEYRLIDHQGSIYAFPQNELLSDTKVKNNRKPLLSFNIAVIDQAWTIELYPLSSQVKQTNPLLNALLVTGILLSLLLAYLVHSNLNKHFKLASTVEKQTKELSHAVSQLKVKNTELEKAIVDANQAAKAKSQFLANMSHEIRTPMNGVIGMADLCLNTSLDDKQTQYLQNIQYCARHLTTVINDILDFSKLESSKLMIENYPFTLTEVVHSVSAAIEKQAKEKDLSLSFKIQQDICIDLIGDGNRIIQVLLNLCSNAVKFTESGFVSIEVTADEHDEQNYSNYHFAVSDSGIGIPQQHLEDLFEAFTQQDASTTRKYGGTGLGLSISQMLCHLMDGEINVTSEEDKGSCFIATARLKRNTDILILSDQALNFAEPKEVLVLEDNAIALETLEQQLTRMGLKVTAIKHPKKAIAKFEQGFNYDAIVMDWAMQEYNGHQFIQALEAMDNLKLPPIVVLSAFSKDVIHSHGTHSAIHEILQKPCRLEHLFEAIELCFNRPYQHCEDKTLALQNLHILVAEDNLINRLVINEMLIQLGAVVEMVEDGKQCIDKLGHDQSFDLVLMDIQMPVMDGIEATVHIRQQLHLIDLPIIAVTANVLDQDIQYYMAVGMNAHVSKPIDVKALTETINSIKTVEKQ